jgi:hypothetical protein
MRDILGQGGDGQPGPWPRRLAAIAALLLVTGVIVLHLPRHHRPPAGPAGTVASRQHSLPAPPAPTGRTATGQAAQPDGVIGPTLPWPSSLRLPVAGEQPAWLWPATGRVKQIGGLPRDRAGYQFTAVAGGWAVQASPAAVWACTGCAGPLRPVYFLGDRAQSVTEVGLASAVTPGAAPGTVWLSSYPPDADTSVAAAQAREVSITGTPLGPQLRLPAGYAIDQGTSQGLLLVPVAPQPGTTTDRLWDPGGPQPGRAFDAVIAASASEIAWAPECDPSCRVQVLDLATGRRTTVELPGASSAANGAFSPDGDLLAIEVSFYNGGDDGALATMLDVASTASGRLTAVPDTFASSDALAGFGWPTAGDSLVAELSFTTKVQVASWQPGATRLAVAAIRPGQESDSLIVG